MTGADLANSSLANSELGRLRRRGARILVVISWATTAILFLLGTLLGGEYTWPILLIGLIANLAPTMMLMRGRYDLTSRLMIGTLAAVQPALGVFALSGHACRWTRTCISSSRSRG